MKAVNILQINVCLLVVSSALASLQQETKRREKFANSELKSFNGKDLTSLEPRGKWLWSRSNSVTNAGTEGRKHRFLRPRQANSRGIKLGRFNVGGSSNPGKYNDLLTFAKQKAKQKATEIERQRQEQAKKNKLLQSNRSKKQNAGTDVDEFLQTYWSNGN